MEAIKTFFSEVFRKHTEDDAESIVICGAPGTIPDPAALSSACPKPWLYSRVFLFFLLTTVLLFLANVLVNREQVSNVLVIGAFGVPFTVLMLFFEFNVFRNISFYTVFKALFIGGGLSLILTALLPSSWLAGNTLVMNAFAAGIGEETAKLLVVYWILKRNRAYPYILNGLLIGAAVGAGFAAFETAGYGTGNLLDEGSWMGHHQALLVLSLRNLLAPGGHVVWAAISGAALLHVAGREPLSPAVFGRKAFWAAFVLPLSLHVLWDLPLNRTLEGAMSRWLGLTLAAWCGAAWFIRRGLEEVDSLSALSPRRNANAGLWESAATWRRVLARMLDLVVFVSVASVVADAVREYFGFGNWLDCSKTDFAFCIAVLPTAFLLEAAVFEVFGMTPGKWVFALRVRDGQGRDISSKTYCRRLLRVWSAGLGCGIPLLMPFFGAYQWRRIARRGSTSYDQAMGLDVFQAPIGRLRYGAGCVLPVLAALCSLVAVFQPSDGDEPAGSEPDDLPFCAPYASASGLEFERMEDGTCVFTFELEGGRTQICIVPPDVVQTALGNCMLLVSPVARYGRLGGAFRQACFDENASRTDRIWIRYGDYMALRALVPPASSPADFRGVLEALALDADAAEAGLSPDDAY